MKRILLLALVMLFFSQVSGFAEKPIGNQSQKYLFDGQGYVQPHKILIKVKSHSLSEMQGITFRKPMSATGLVSVDQKLQKYGLKRVKKYLFHEPIPVGVPDDIDRIYEIQYTADVPPWEVAEELESDPNLAYAEPVPVFVLEETPNDPMYSQQEHLPQIHAPEAWNVVKGSANVVIAVVDCGVDYKHEDLAANVWVNEAEKNGQPGVDDDGNGFVDDVHGYDLSEDDPDPINPPKDAQGYYSHGTHVTGLADAVTDNSVGIAGSSWNCRYMAVKCAKDDSPRYITNGYEGITYAADNGADVINLSWGGGGYSQSGQDVIDYAYNKGAVVVASAGNDPTSKPHFPSAYRHVLSVGVVDSQNQKPEWGTWGVSVDLMAPGYEVLSTLPGNTYGRMSGSSMSTPVASGIVALVKSEHPGWSPDSLMEQVAFTADNIDVENPGVVGLLGGGVIDAFRAVTEVNPIPSPPKLLLTGTDISDSSFGNNNGIFEQGEIITIKAKFHNYSMGTGTNLQFFMDAGSDSIIKPLNSPIHLSFVDKEADVNLPEEFSFLIKNGAKSHMAKVALGYTCDQGYSRADTIRILIGKTPVLLVDDDDGENNVEGFYISTLKKLGVNYGIWDHTKMGTPSGKYLSNFPIVIWFCEWTFPSLDPSDREALKAYLNNGGNLFLSGQDIGWDLMDATSTNHTFSSEQFFRTYLHSDYLADNAEDDQVKGVFGGPIGSNLNFRINQPGRDATEQYPDVISPERDAFPIWQYKVNGGFGGVRFAGDYKVAYFGFGFEAIDAPMSVSEASKVTENRETVMARVLNYLNPLVVTPLKDSENTEMAFPVEAILKSDTIGLKGVNLYWKFRDQSAFQKIPMNRNGRVFDASIPAPHQTAHIDYYLELENTYYNWQAPAGAPNHTYQFYVGPDTIAPKISFEKLPNVLNGESPFNVTAKVTDNVSVNPNSVFVHFQSKSSPEDSVELSPGTESGLFTGAIPPIAAYGDTLFYWFSAVDNSISKNRALSDTSSFLIGLDDFEGGLSNWFENPPGWGLDETYAYSGSFSINDSPGKTYGLNEYTIIETNFEFDFSKTSKAMLSFMTKYYLEFDHDFGYIEVSSDGGTTWQQLGEKIGGVSTKWQEIRRSLTAFTGPGFNHVKLRFRMVTDNHQGPPFMGWFIDDVRVFEGKDLTDVVSESNSNQLPKRWEVLQNYPNPFNPETRITIRVPKKQFVQIDVYNVVGQLVTTLAKKVFVPGEYRFIWKGSDTQENPVPSGIYFLQVRGKNFNQTQKMILMR